MIAHYTWSKSLDHDAGYYAIDPRVNYGPDDFNRKHVFVLSEVYELPFGRGKQFMSSANRGLDAIFGGWQVNSVTSWESGLPFSPQYQLCSADRDTGPCRAILVGDVSTGGSRHGFFGVSPALLGANGAVSGPYLRPQKEQFGSGRNSVFGPHFFNTDLSVFKNFTITERIRTQFRAEAFNVFNHVNLGQPSNCVDCDFDSKTGLLKSATRSDGTITSIASNALMRQFQFALRVTF
ncbi:MAG: hypothetical protein DMG67_12770 [Acidobacteria bacterium]|nr:MAG: hypothetical protein DMG67_12770 [Acidobacteriota bacterium]